MEGGGGEEEEEDECGDVGQLAAYRERRDELYRKMRDSNRGKIRGAAGFYAEEARQLNSIIKAAEREKQKEEFNSANSCLPQNKLDLHYLTAGEAIKELSSFLSGKEPGVTVEVVTGRGSRSERGRARLRPAVTQWLQQKGYSFSQVA